MHWSYIWQRSSCPHVVPGQEDEWSLRSVHFWPGAVVCEGQLWVGSCLSPEAADGQNRTSCFRLSLDEAVFSQRFLDLLPQLDFVQIEVVELWGGFEAVREAKQITDTLSKHIVILSRLTGIALLPPDIKILLRKLLAASPAFNKGLC